MHRRVDSCCLYTPRSMRDPDSVDAALSALFWRSPLAIDGYYGIQRKHTNIVIEPWTLVHAMDGLYLLGPLAGESKPKLWALHRMEGAAWVRGTTIRLSEEYRPDALLGHGYGPFLAGPGRVVIRVPKQEAPWVLESALPNQVGEPEEQDDGSFLVHLDVSRSVGLELWARGMGVEVVG
jgi:hypothetical protein